MQTFKKADLAAIQQNKGHIECLQELRAIARAITESQDGRESHFAQASVAFLSRMMQHAENLIKIGETLDAWLIARSALEGFVLYAWMATDPNSREEKATEYGEVAYIEGHSLGIRLNRYTGTKFSEFNKAVQERAQLNNGIEVEEAIRIASGREAFAKSYLERITGKSLKQLFDELDASLHADELHKSIYELHYSMFSGYHHWSPLYFNVSATGPFEYYDGTPSDYGIALSLTVGVVMAMCNIANDFFGSGLSERLDTVATRNDNLT